MPVLQYICRHCNKSFEELVKKHDDKVLCPDCGQPAERCYCGQMFPPREKQQKNAAATAKPAAAVNNSIIKMQGRPRKQCTDAPFCCAKKILPPRFINLKLRQ